MKYLSHCFLGFMLLWPLHALSAHYPLPDRHTTVVGKLQRIHPRKTDNFETLAQRYEVGFFELKQANPNVNPYSITPNTLITIPSQYVLPNTPHKGIVINLAELRLYYYPNNRQEVITYPIGIGTTEHQTPVGRYYVLEKSQNPIWHAPPSVRERYRAQGILIPKTVSPGPTNPLGHYALRLDNWSYLIHGTNQPASVGIRSSSGCIHLFEHNIRELFRQVHLKTPVRIVNQATKIGMLDQQPWLEVEAPLSETPQSDEQLAAQFQRQFKKQFKHRPLPDVKALTALLHNRDGLPHKLGQEKNSQNKHCQPNNNVTQTNKHQPSQ